VSILSPLDELRLDSHGADSPLLLPPQRWTNRSDAQLWTTLSKVKQRILGWATLGTGDDGRPIKKGQRVQAIKFLQKAVLVQTKGPNDPRVSSFFLPFLSPGLPFLESSQS